MKIKDILPKESIAFQAVSASYYDPEKKDLTDLMSIILECDLDSTDMFGFKIEHDSRSRISDILDDHDTDDQVIFWEVIKDIIDNTDNTFSYKQ